MKKAVVLLAIGAVFLVPRDGRGGLLDPIVDPIVDPVLDAGTSIVDPVVDAGTSIVDPVVDAGTGGVGTIGTPGTCVAGVCIPSVTLGPVDIEILPTGPIGETPPPPTAPPTVRRRPSPRFSRRSTIIRYRTSPGSPRSGPVS